MVTFGAWTMDWWAWMTDEARRIAWKARQLGYRAVVLGQASEEHWDALRILLGAEHVAPLVLADAVDLMQAFEQGEVTP